MKLYHIDRSGHIKEGQIIEYINEIEHNVLEYANIGKEILNNYFDNKLSSHGRQYFLDEYRSPSYVMDIIFEYERRLHYPEKISRYQAFFAFDRDGVIDFINSKDLNHEYYKIYEVEYNEYERHNMNLIRGWSHFDTVIRARYYWEDIEDYEKNRKPVYEYLLKLPVIIKKSVSYFELLEEKEETKKD